MRKMADLRKIRRQTYEKTSRRNVKTQKGSEGNDDAQLRRSGGAVANDGTSRTAHVRGKTQRPDPGQKSRSGMADQRTRAAQMAGAEKITREGT